MTPERETLPAWRALTPGQQIMMRRLQHEGALQALKPWEMRTVRSLLARGLVRPRRPGCTVPGLWFLTAKGSRIVPHEADAVLTEPTGQEDPVFHRASTLQPQHEG